MQDRLTPRNCKCLVPGALCVSICQDGEILLVCIPCFSPLSLRSSRCDQKEEADEWMVDFDHSYHGKSPSIIDGVSLCKDFLAL